ncbi:MAG: SMP-30/gluconolactonase/LRE family protein [Chloroflexota bacterium]
MRRWAIAFTAVLALVSTQPVLAATFRQGVVQNFADLATASCHNPEGITADAGGTLYAAGLSGNICVVNGSGQVTRVITVAAGHALLGEIFVDGQIYVADNNGDFSGARVDRVNVATGAVTVVASGFANTNAFERDGNGTLFVSDSFRGAVYTVNPTTGATAQWIQDEALRSHGFPGFGANGLAFDASRSNLYVANTGDDRIFRVAVNPDGSAGALSIFADGATINAAHHTTGALDGADGIVFDASGRLWICANQANEVQILSPTGTNLVKRFSGTGDNAMNFPASPVFVGHAMFVANLYFATPGAGKISVLGAAPGAP